MQQAQDFYQKYGYWSLLLSWTPIISDPITLIAGLLKENFWRFSAGKRGKNWALSLRLFDFY